MISYNPWADLSSRTDLTLILADLPYNAHALYFPDVPGIALSRSLTQLERRCALAHELAHIDLGHRQVAGSGQGCDRLARKQERDADALAARRLISLEALTTAARCNENLPAPTALELQVTRLILEARIESLRAEESSQIRHELNRLEIPA